MSPDTRKLLELVPSIVNARGDEIQRAFARMDKGLKRILLEQEQRRRAVRKRLLAVVDVK
jgi:hypothetical protein